MSALQYIGFAVMAAFTLFQIVLGVRAILDLYRRPESRPAVARAMLHLAAALIMALVIALAGRVG